MTQCCGCQSQLARYKAILLFGAPGSGKGTQGKILAAIPGFLHTSTGDLFRALDPSSDLGKVFREYSTRGELVPDSFTIDLWKEHMRKVVESGRFKLATDLVLLDGVPRNVNQARLLADAIDVVKIICLDTDKLDVMVERLKKRAQKEGRADDADESVIRNRMDVYRTNTTPILDFYPKDKIAKVEATLSMIGVFTEIAKIVRPIKDALDGYPVAQEPSPRPAAKKAPAKKPVKKPAKKVAKRAKGRGR